MIDIPIEIYAAIISIVIAGLLVAVWYSKD